MPPSGYPPYGNPEQPPGFPQQQYPQQSYPPQQGYAPQSTYPPAGYPPPVRPSEVTPSRWWYAGAALVAVISTVAGIVLGIVGLATNAPDFSSTFTSNETRTFSLSSGETAALYAGQTEEDSYLGIECSPSSDIKLTRPDSAFHFSKDGKDWRHVFTIEARSSGQHQILCTSKKDLTLAIGRVPNTGVLAGSFIVLLGAPCLGIVIGIVIAIIVAVKRKSNRERLQRERGQRFP